MRRPLRRHTITWRRRDDHPGRTRTVTYVREAHHDDAPAARAKNEQIAIGLDEYNEACRRGQAIVITHDVEDDDGQA